MTGGREGRLGQRKYAVLLALLCISLTIETFGVQSAERLLSDAVATGLYVAIWVVVFHRPSERAAMAAVLAAGVAMFWGHYFAVAGFDRALFLVAQALLSLLLWSAVYVILRDLFSTRSAGAESVLGAICGYLVAGGAWGRINAITYLLAPSAYSINPEISALLPDWHGRVALFTYYAFAQMLMLGYNDVTPVRAPATTWSLFAALFGVFYMAVVVSQFVGLAQSGKGGGSGNE